MHMAPKRQVFSPSGVLAIYRAKTPYRSVTTAGTNAWYKLFSRKENGLQKTAKVMSIIICLWRLQ